MRQTGYPRGRPGYVVDHLVPLACGGPDSPNDMQWQSKVEANDRWGPIASNEIWIAAFCRQRAVLESSLGVRSCHPRDTVRIFFGSPRLGRWPLGQVWIELSPKAAYSSVVRVFAQADSVNIRCDTGRGVTCRRIAARCGARRPQEQPRAVAQAPPLAATPAPYGFSGICPDNPSPDISSP
jgi:hypothetical protein